MFLSIVQLPTQRYQRKRSISGESWVKCIHGENERRIKSEEAEHVKKASFQEKGSQQCPWEHEKWRQSWSHLGTNLPLSQMRKLRLRETMRPSQGHSVLGDDRRALHNSEYEWQIQTLPWARVAASPSGGPALLVFQPCFHASPAPLNLVSDRERQARDGSTSANAQNALTLMARAPVHLVKSTVLVGTGQEAKQVLSWHGPALERLRRWRSHMPDPPKAQLLPGENEGGMKPRRGHTRERVHIH